MNQIRTLTLKFKNEIEESEISCLRGAIINFNKNTDCILFHNHDENNFRYSYPLIQYKRMNRCASVVAINEGVDAVCQYLSQCDLSVTLGQREVVLVIDTLQVSRHEVNLDTRLHTYQIKKWLPLNQHNYDKYMQLTGLVERIQFLENILVANILSFAKGLNFRFSDRLDCKILDMSEPHAIRFKNIDLLSFNLEFVSNVKLTDNLGIGKNASLGFGIITKI